MLAANAILVLASFSAIDTPQLYYFTSESCPACHKVEPAIAELQAQGVPVNRVDVKQRREWTQQAQVDALPTFIAVANGQEVGRLVGLVSFRDLSQLYLQAIRQHAQVKQTPTRPLRQLTEKDKRSADWPAQAQNTASPRFDRSRSVVTTAAGASSHREEMVRGQTPQRARPGDRLKGAFDSLTGRTVCSQCRGCRDECQCASGGQQESVITPAKHTPAASSQSSVDEALAATVRLKIIDEIGQSFGTGTIIDVHDDEALVLTCGHIFRESEGKGAVLCDSFARDAKPEIQGKLVSYDLRRDIGLVSFRPGVPIQPVSIGGIGERPKDDDEVFSIGCNHGNDPTVIKNRIIAINRYHGPPNIVAGGRPVNGRSGGGLFSAHGTLIGVCNAADPEYDEGLYAALGNVHAELDSVGLGFIYRKQQADIALGIVGTRAQPPQPRSKDGGRASDARKDPISDPILPVSGPPTSKNQKDRASNIPPQANVDEESDRSSAKLTASIRWPENPDSAVELIIDRPSRQLLDQLAREANSRGPHRQTHLPVRHGHSARRGWRSLGRQ